MNNVVRCFLVLSWFCSVYAGPYKKTNTSNQQVKERSIKKYALRSCQLEGENYVLVPENLVGPKLQRYFSCKSAAVVLMACCQTAQVHRRCLQGMFHGQQGHESCPCCHAIVNRSLYSRSRPEYLSPDQRQQFCDCCHEALGWRPILKKS